MPSDSLIFLVIMAIWAVYFIQYWVRRREHLATARSVDRFSESMRVLERRAPLATDLSTPQPRSYAVSPARSVRAHVVVKRAEPSAHHSQAHHSQAHHGPAHHAPADVEPDGHDESDGRLEISRPSTVTSRQARGLSFLAALVTLPVAIALSAAGTLPWWVVIAPVTAIGGVLAWLRHAAVAEHAERTERSGSSATRAHRRASASADHDDLPARSVRATPSGRVDRADRLGSEVEPLVMPQPAALFDGEAPRRAPAAAAASAVAADAGVAAHDASAAAGIAAQSPRPLVDEDDIPLTWDPVPVPRPTYTMKAKAERPAPAPAEVTETPQRAEAAYEQDVRRAAGA